MGSFPRGRLKLVPANLRQMFEDLWLRQNAKILHDRRVTDVKCGRTRLKSFTVVKYCPEGFDCGGGFDFLIWHSPLLAACFSFTDCWFSLTSDTLTAHILLLLESNVCWGRFQHGCSRCFVKKSMMYSFDLRSGCSLPFLDSIMMCVVLFFFFSFPFCSPNRKRSAKPGAVIDSLLQ